MVESYQQDPPDPVDDTLADAVGQLSKFLCMERYTDNRPTSTIIVYFSGVMGISSSGSTFERPRNYTSKLSALIYCIRLCLLEATLPRFAHTGIGWSARPSMNNLQRLNRVREHFMCYSCQAPMDELLSLRSYGRALSRSDGPSFRVNWSDDGETVVWDAGKLNMGQFRELGHDALQSATLSFNRIMRGFKGTLQLDNIRDKLSNHTEGYSFVHDPANALQAAYIDLCSHVCLDSKDGLLLGDQWDMSAVDRYLEEEKNLLIQLMLLMFLRGGQSPRSTELLSLEHRNDSGNSRGIYIYNKSVVYVTRHWKARQSTNREFHVVRYLPREDSQLLVGYLVYVRPFSDMLYRTCYGYKQDRRFLFASAGNTDQPWRTDILRKAIQKLTHRVCDISFGVQIYRQISIAITEKHIKHISKPFNRYDDKSGVADIDVAFSWQSGHRPLQREATYGIDGAFPDSLQPALLRVYEWASREWHEFLMIRIPILPTKVHETASLVCRKRRASAFPQSGTKPKQSKFTRKTTTSDVIRRKHLS